MSQNKLAYEQKWARQNPKKYLLYKARARAKQKNILCTITESDFEIPELWPILGVKLNDGRQVRSQRDTSPSLDRINNDIGYVPGNVAIISFKANKLKGELTQEQLERLLAYVST